MRQSPAPRNGSHDSSIGAVREQLLAEIRAGRYRQGEALPSIRELARRMKLSKATAERAVRSLVADGICEAQHGRGVFVAVSDAGELSERLRTNPTFGVVFGYLEYPRADNAFFRELYEGLQGWMLDHGANTLKLYRWRAKPVAQKRREVARHTPHLDGLVTLGIYADEDCILLRNTGTPLVALDYDTTALGVDCVVMDNEAGMADLAARALDAAPGPVLFLTPFRRVHDDPANAERLRGAERAAKKHGRAFGTEHVLHVLNTADGAKALARDLARAVKPASHAVLLLDDDAVLPLVIEALRARNLEPGRDVCLAYLGSAGGARAPQSEKPSALVLEYDFRAMGRAAGELLAERIAKGPGRPVLRKISGTVRMLEPAAVEEHRA